MNAKITLIELTPDDYKDVVVKRCIDNVEITCDGLEIRGRILRVNRPTPVSNDRFIIEPTYVHRELECPVQIYLEFEVPLDVPVSKDTVFEIDGVRKRKFVCVGANQDVIVQDVIVKCDNLYIDGIACGIELEDTQRLEFALVDVIDYKVA